MKVKINYFPGPLGWTWVKLGELVEFAQKISGGYYTSTKVFLESFIKLSKDYYDSGILTYCEDLEKEEVINDKPPPNEEIYIPSGWARDVIICLIHGVRRVDDIPLGENCDKVPKGALARRNGGGIIYALVGINDKGEPMILPPLVGEEDNVGSEPDIVQKYRRYYDL